MYLRVQRSRSRSELETVITVKATDFLVMEWSKREGKANTDP